MEAEQIIENKVLSSINDDIEYIDSISNDDPYAYNEFYLNPERFQLDEAF
jgi:hypothetical protein